MRVYTYVKKDNKDSPFYWSQARPYMITLKTNGLRQYCIPLQFNHNDPMIDFRGIMKEKDNTAFISDDYTKIFIRAEGCVIFLKAHNKGLSAECIESNVENKSIWSYHYACSIIIDTGSDDNDRENFNLHNESCSSIDLSRILMCGNIEIAVGCPGSTTHTMDYVFLAKASPYKIFRENWFVELKVDCSRREYLEYYKTSIEKVVLIASVLESFFIP